jgi:hydroxypyruvate isomerase
MATKTSRRSALIKLAAGAAVVSVASKFSSASGETLPLKGRIHQSVCRWCYKNIPLDDLCVAGKEMGLVAIDLLDPNEFETVKKHDLACSMVNSPTIDGLGGIAKGWNRLEHHGKLVQAYEQRIGETAEAGYERLICFSGNRGGLGELRNRLATHSALGGETQGHRLHGVAQQQTHSQGLSMRSQPLGRRIGQANQL